MTPYEAYQNEKIVFLENIIDNLMERFDKGGTIPVFPDYKDWFLNKVDLSKDPEK